MTSQATSGQAPRKKSYERPKLLKFGDVGELTQAVGDTGLGDGSGALMLKTRP